jgi:hypothetical protein
MGLRLAGAERDDAADGIVWRDAHRDSIPWDHLDAEAAHSTAQLGQHFVTGVALHAIKPTTVHGNHRTLHINKIVLAQLLAILSDNYYATC